MRVAVFAFLLAALFSSAGAHGMTTDERRRFLDDIRPAVARQAHQPVRFKVDRLNQDGDWALLVGELLPEAGKAMDWERADCDANLDKMLFIVARRGDKGWTTKHVFLCSPEPPYWYLDQFGGFVWPCGLYAGLDAGNGDLQAECRKSRRQGR